MAFSEFDELITSPVARRSLSSSFFSTMPVFGRREYAKAVGRSPHDRVVTSMLAHHLRAGNIRRIARGLFASVPTHISARSWTPDRFLAAARLRRGAVIAYHSALELHGYAPAASAEIQLIAPGEPGVVATADFTCRFISPSHRLSPSEGVITAHRHGVAIRITSLERTLVDAFDRYSLAGGARKLFGALDIVASSGTHLNIDGLIGHAERLGNAAAAAALGYWLECERARLAVTEAALRRLRSSAPKQSRYALGARPGRGRAATGWNVILPSELIERYLDD